MRVMWCFEGEGNNKGSRCLKPRDFQQLWESTQPKNCDHLLTKEEYLTLCLLVFVDR
ncbi:unnamed protein product [Musa hybrid cultivar]